MRSMEIPHGQAGRTFLIGPSDHVDYRVLAANTKEDHTVPTGADAVIFSCVDDSGNPASFYANFRGVDAAVPAADITDGSGPELNPTQRYIPGIGTISLIAPAACIVMMAFYKVGS
jgi:hypothetical protein